MLQLDEHTTAILEAVTDILADSERKAREHINTLGERQAIFAEDLSHLVGTAADQAEASVREHLREDRLDLDEALFAARKRYDRLTAAFEERLADIRDGEPGPPGESGEQGPEGLPGRSFCLRGTWQDINDYQAMDVVTKDGASFAARSDHPGPCPGDGWQMIARGNRGNQGERGAAGAKGERGEPGLPVVAMSVSEEGMLTLTNGDGSVVTCDLYPVLKR